MKYDLLKLMSPEGHVKISLEKAQNLTSLISLMLKAVLKLCFELINFNNNVILFVSSSFSTSVPQQVQHYWFKHLQQEKMLTFFDT